MVWIVKHLTDDNFKWQNRTRGTWVNCICSAMLELGVNRFRLLKLSKYFQSQYMVVRNLLWF